MTGEAEFALLVSDRFQRGGLGRELLRRLLEVVRDEKLPRITAEIHPENRAMERICEQLGFRFQRETTGRVLKAAIELSGGTP